MERMGGFEPPFPALQAGGCAYSLHPLVFLVGKYISYLANGRRIDNVIQSARRYILHT